MQITEITTKNFGRLGSVHIDLNGSKVHLFCGPNESGKSTLSEAVRFALLGDSPRIELKKDHDLLVTDGHSKGRVTLGYLAARGAVPQSVYRDVHTNGAVTKDFKLDEMSTTCMQIALQARTFASSDAAARRKLLTNLLDIKMSANEIADRLKADYEVPEALIATIKPLLRNGFDAAHLSAKTEMSKARGAWEGATGERFGTEKAKEWKPKEAPENVTDEQLSDALVAATAASDALEEAIKAIAKAEGSAAARAHLVEQKDKLLELKKNERQVRNQRVVRQLKIPELEGELSGLRDQLRWADEAKKILLCPNCDCSLHLKDGVLQPVAVTELETIVDRGSTAEGARADIVAGITATEKLLADERAALARLSAQLEAITNADSLISKIDLQLGEMGEPPTDEEHSSAMQQLQSKRDDARTASDNARLAYDTLKDKRALHNQHLQKAGMAKKASADYFAWDKAADALSPTGLPAKLLADALTPINKRLETSAALAKWPRVQLNNEVELVRSTKEEPDRRLSMISESAQWRACAVMADSISSLSQLKLLILDRADVLDLPGRTQLFNWLGLLAEDEYDTILVFATLKAAPTSEQVGGARVHWLPDIVKNQSKEK